jgi:hypothetical protein
MDTDTLAHPEAEICMVCKKALKETHDHGVNVVPSPKGPRPVFAIPRPFGLGKYAASIQAHINEEVRLADEIEELKETIKALRAIIWPGAILEHHYGGSHNKPHTNLLAGDLVEGCTEGYCPEWWRVYKLAAQPKALKEPICEPCGPCCMEHPHWSHAHLGDL